MTNIEIARLFRNVAASFSIRDDKKYRFQILAYQKAADTIEAMTSQVEVMSRENKLNDLPGIGTSMKAHIDELAKTGHVKHFEEILSHVPASVFPLIEIPSIGPKKAYKLVKAFVLNDPKTVINDLEKEAKAGHIASLDTFGEKSEQDILRAITEYRSGFGKTTRMLLPFATELAEKIVAYLKTSKYVEDASPLGSLRRSVTTVGDLDIAVATEHPAEVIQHFVAYPYKERVMEQGTATASIMASGGRQVDLMTQPKESFGSLLQHFTGSKNHNVHLREIALRKGISMSEYGIKFLKEGNVVHCSEEKKVYETLGMEWIPPEMREDTGEIELAMKRTLPKVIELNDIKGDFHIHSNYPIDPSHDLGTDTMEAMLEEAKKLNYEYLAFSEHNPSVSKHSADQMQSILAKRKEKIESLKLKYKSIRILNLLEIDILANGNLAISNKDFEFLDGGIVSIHSSFSMNAEQMTNRVLKGLSHPKAKILAHPSGRLLNERPGYTLDWEQVFAFCKNNNKALEINSWPQRLDLTDTLIRQAIEKGVKLVIDSDSHALKHMHLMRYGVALARRGWATPNDIINSWEYNRVEQWIMS